MYNSLNGFLIDSKEILDYDLCHEAALDCYLLGLEDGENKYQPKRVVINGIKFNVDSLDFKQFVSKIVGLPAEFNYALYHLAKFKIDYQIETGESLNIRIDLREYILNILDFGTPEEINLIINALVKWRDIINFYYQKQRKQMLDIIDDTAISKTIGENDNKTLSDIVPAQQIKDFNKTQTRLKQQTKKDELPVLENDDSDDTSDPFWDDDLDDDDLLDDDLPKPSQAITKSVNDILKAAQNNLISEQKQKENQEKDQAIDSEMVPIDRKIVSADSETVSNDNKIVPTSTEEQAESAARHADALRKKILDKRTEMFAKNANNNVINSKKTSQNKSAKK